MPGGGNYPERGIGSPDSLGDRRSLTDRAPRETVSPGLIQAVAPLRGRYMRPRSIQIGSTPQRLLPADPNRLGVFILNNGGTLELPLALPPLTTAFIDSAIIPIPVTASSTYKTIHLLITTALTWTTAGQATIQLTTGRVQMGAAGGAASGLDVQHVVLGAAGTSIGGASVSTLAAQLFALSPADITHLQWHHPFIGIEFKFPSALLTGAMVAFLQMPGSPQLLVGEDIIISGEAGEKANSWALPGFGAPTFIQDDGEIWVAASVGGLVDCRYWVVLREGPAPGWG